MHLLLLAEALDDRQIPDAVLSTEVYNIILNILADRVVTPHAPAQLMAISTMERIFRDMKDAAAAEGEFLTSLSRKEQKRRKKTSRAPNQSTVHAMVRMYCAHGRQEKAQSMLFDHSQRLTGTPVRARSCTPLLGAYVEAKDLRGVMSVWNMMEAAAVVPTEEHFVTLLKALADSGTLEKMDEGDADARRTVSRILRQLGDCVLKPSEETLSQLLLTFGPQRAGAVCIDSRDGVCSLSGVKLQLLGLTNDERARVGDKLLDIAERRNGVDQRKRLAAFRGWLGRRSAIQGRAPFTYIIDGANVGYFGQNFEHGRFSFRQIDVLARFLQGLGEEVLIVLPHPYRAHRRANVPNSSSFAQHRVGVAARATRKRGAPGLRTEPVRKDEKALVEAWERQGMITFCPPHCNDDWYWMMASIEPPPAESAGEPSFIKVISNDNMRDHRIALDVLEPRPFLRWHSTQIAQFSLRPCVGNGRPPAVKSILAPLGYSREVQCRVTTGAPSSAAVDANAAHREVVEYWHLPYPIAEESDAIRGEVSGEHDRLDRWLCIALGGDHHDDDGVVV